jgi:hypothetical protein
MRPLSSDSDLSTADSLDDLAAILAAFPDVPARAPVPAIMVTSATVASLEVVLAEEELLCPDSPALTLVGSDGDDDADSIYSIYSAYSDDDSSDAETAVDADELLQEALAAARPSKKVAVEGLVWWAQRPVAMEAKATSVEAMQAELRALMRF